VEFKFKLNSDKYQFFHICYDGFINLIVENTLNGLELRYAANGATTTLTAIAPGWHTILIDVQHGVMQNPAFYRVKLDNGLNWMNAVKFSDTNLPNLYFGVDVAKSGYGKVYFDDIWVYHFLPGNRYGNYDLFATFEQDSNGVLHGWSIDPTTTGTVCPDGQVVHNDDQVSLRIRSPQSQQPAIDNRAWVNTMSYPLNDAHDYELSLDIYIPSGMQCNFFHIAFNRHVDLVIKGPNADGTDDIHAVTGPNQGQMQIVAKLNTGWHLIKCPVNVEAPVGGHKRYDLYIDWPANPNPVKANIQSYSDGNADHYIGMGDDNENGQAPVDRNFGELYYDNVRIEQFY
jgi:hypothetical protein